MWVKKLYGVLEGFIIHCVKTSILDEVLLTGYVSRPVFVNSKPYTRTQFNGEENVELIIDSSNSTTLLFNKMLEYERSQHVKFNDETANISYKQQFEEAYTRIKKIPSSLEDMSPDIVSTVLSWNSKEIIWPAHTCYNPTVDRTELAPTEKAGFAYTNFVDGEFKGLEAGRYTLMVNDNVHSVIPAGPPKFDYLPKEGDRIQLLKAGSMVDIKFIPIVDTHRKVWYNS